MSNLTTLTVPQLREQIKELDPKLATSKLRKAELVQLLQDLQDRQPAEPRPLEGSEPELDVPDYYGPQVGEPKIFQGAMHEAAAQAAQGVRGMGNAIKAVADHIQRATRALRVHPPRQNARLRGLRVLYQVRGALRWGAVVDVVLRGDGLPYGDRALYVVQDLVTGTRTMHAANDTTW